MSKFRVRRLAFDVRERLREEFYRVFASLESLDEIRAVCRDLFSPSEIIMFIRRLHIARLLIAGETYKAIMKTLAVGNSTVKTVAHRLSRRGRGFEIVDLRLDAILPEIAEEIRLEIERVENPQGMENLKRKYSMYYWPELLVRDAPKFVRNLKAARGRKKSLKKK
jgi:uncharacterized protein YerC